MSSDTQQQRQRMTQNYSVAWIDGAIDQSGEDFQQKFAELQSIIHEAYFFTKSDDCIQYLNTTLEKVFLITTGFLGQDLVPRIHDMQQLHAIYILCGDKTRHELWAQKWSKIEGVLISMKPIYESLKKVARQVDYDTVPISFISSDLVAEVKAENRNQLPPSFIYSSIFKDITLEMNEDDMQAIRDLVNYCESKGVPKSELNLFRYEYYQKSAIWWYTYEFFLYGMLNRALRTLDTEAMLKMGFFIRALHQQL